MPKSKSQRTATQKSVSYLPTPPNDKEVGHYIKRHIYWLIIPSLISMTCLTISQVNFIVQSPWLYPFFGITLAVSIYYLISLSVNIGTKDFSYDDHRTFVAGYWSALKHNARHAITEHTARVIMAERSRTGRVVKWHFSDSPAASLHAPTSAPTVDVFMPVCGEPLDVLRNSWKYISKLQYPSDKIVFHVLDDSKHPDIKRLARQFKFNYITRDNNTLQKAGNMLNAFWKTDKEYVLVFDADFCPRGDMLRQIVPYLECDSSLGIVQTPQYFRINPKQQNWLERGASAVQELFYRVVQTSRERHEAAICVGTNALYRREALVANGGPTQIGHSEDVHTGFDLRRLGWRVCYLPINLSTGTCPSEIPAFLAQQYRWCMGSMSLLSHRKFWQHNMKLRTRFGYFSGFLYYIMTAVLTIVAPFIPIYLLAAHPHLVILTNYLFILPSIIYSLIIFPLVWHRNMYWIAAFSTRFIYGWAHLFALCDVVRGTAKAWSPTGEKSHAKKSTKAVLYCHFRLYATVISGGGALAWVGLAAWRMATEPHWYDYAPMLALGSFGLVIVALPLATVWKDTVKVVAMKAETA